MKTALVIMAAGIGSRFGGGIKQLAAVGPNGEIIMDYSIHDAIEAGFDKIVFIIRHDIEEAFKEAIGDRIEKICADLGVEIDYAFQALENVPAGYSVPEGRSKPWGTGQAVLACKGIIKEPFAVINADDFYGRDGFRVLGQWLSKADGENRYCMVGYRVGNTLSESGTVARGICRTDANNYLTGVVERTDIARVDGRITFTGDDGQPTTTDDNTPVSMNMWGFTPDYFRYSEEYFKEFLRANIDNPKAEYYIPLMVNKLITEGTATVEVLVRRDLRRRPSGRGRQDPCIGRRGRIPRQTLLGR
mgnify:CR=1 FL=1